MNKEFSISNKFIIIAISSIFILTICTLFLFPAISFFLSPMSRIGAFFSSYFFYIIIFVGFCLYFLYYTFFFSLKLDPYALKIISYSPLNLFSTKKRNIEISHSMLKHFSLEKSKCESNSILKLDIVTSSGRLISKDFHFSFLHPKQKKNLVDRLDKILLNNQKS